MIYLLLLLLLRVEEYEYFIDGTMNVLDVKSCRLRTLLHACFIAIVVVVDDMIGCCFLLVVCFESEKERERCEGLLL